MNMINCSCDQGIRVSEADILNIQALRYLIIANQKMEGMHGSTKGATVPCVVSVLRCGVNIFMLPRGGLAQIVNQKAVFLGNYTET